MSKIQLKKITKRFDDVTAVNSIDLTVNDSEFLVLVGPSGCGKSTTLRLMAGLETITDGTLEIGDEVVNGVEPKDRDLAMVFQDYALFPHMTARKNMKFGMNSSGSYSSEEIEELVAEAASILDIEGLLDRKPSELSGGEQQRVAMGRSLVRNPQVFLMDEPLSNLDAKLRIQMRAELAQLHEELQTTTVYVTHDQIEAMTLGDRVAVMNAGEIEQVAPPQQLYTYPDTQFVAEFIGSPPMNMLPVQFRSVGDSHIVEHEGFSITLPPQDELEQIMDTEVLLGIRPENLKIVDDPDTINRAVIDLEVTLVESLGDSLLLYTRVGEDELQVVTYEPQRQVSEGDHLRVTYDTDRLHLFDSESGEAIYHSDTYEEREVAPTNKQQ